MTTLCGGRTVVDGIDAAFKMLMADTVGAMYSYQGKRGKQKFCELKTLES
jgi:hypothetical protein